MNPARFHTRPVSSTDLRPVSYTSATRSHGGVEILEILHSALILGELAPESDDSQENMRTVKLIATVHGDVVLRLCELTDRDHPSGLILNLNGQTFFLSLHFFLTSSKG